MNRQVNAIAGRPNLRLSQRRSLEILDCITKIATPKKGTDVGAVLKVIRSLIRILRDVILHSADGTGTGDELTNMTDPIQQRIFICFVSVRCRPPDNTPSVEKMPRE